MKQNANLALAAGESLQRQPVDLEEHGGVWNVPEHPPVKCPEPPRAPSLRKKRTINVESTTTPVVASAAPADTSNAVAGQKAASEKPLATKQKTPPVTAPVMTVAGYEIHPLALAFPLLPEPELNALVEDICRNGQLQKAVLYEGKILDGRGRGAGCERAGVALKTELLPENISPVDFVVAANLRRRHMSAAQRAVVAANLMPYYESEAAKRKQLLSGTRANPDGSLPEVTETLPEPDECGEAREKAAKATGANPRYVSDAVKLRREAPELFRAVELGKMSIPKAFKELDKKHEADSPQGPVSTQTALLAVLWDDSDAPPTRAPEKSYGPKTYPNLVFFRFYEAGDTKVQSASHHGLTQVALFVVPVEQGVLAKDKQGTAICKVTCRFLAFSVRGDVPGPTVVPGQIVEGGYEGVVKMISTMYPTVLKAVSTTQEQAPDGWEHVPRQSTAGAPPTVSGAAPDSPKRPEGTVKVSATPYGAAGSPKSVGKSPAKVEKGQTPRTRKATTIGDKLHKLRDGFESIAAELRRVQNKLPENLRQLDSYKSREQATIALEAATNRVDEVIASLGVPNGSELIGDLPFVTDLVVTGSAFKRVQRMGEILKAVAESIQSSVPQIAQELEAVAADLTRLRGGW